MCGIVAIFSKEANVSEPILKQAMHSLNHRRPDENNFWISDNLKVGLGHVRLNIIDLQSGKQPICNHIESLYIIANGEFYDYENIRHNLKKQGFCLKTHSDSEIALHLYDLYGANCLNYLQGEFAFIIWDEQSKVLFAARDRFGIKPLYYSIFQGTLYIASEIKALFAAGIPASWNYESFFLADAGVLPPHQTLFANVYQVPSGHYLIASSPIDIQTYSYWDFDYPCANNLLEKRPLEEHIENLRYVLDESIRLRLRADVPIAFYLSGGLDSSTLLGMAAKHLTKPIQSFTISFDDENYDEVTYAQKMATHVGANLEIVNVKQADLAEYFSEAIWHGEMLWQNANTTAKYLLSQAVRNAGYKVVITGEGADELFGGYASFQQDMLFSSNEKQDEQMLQQQWEKLKFSNPTSSGFIMAETLATEKNLDICQRLLGFVPSWMKAFSESQSKSSDLYSTEFLKNFSQRNPYFILLNHINVQGQLLDREVLAQSSYLWTKTFFTNYVLRMEGDGLEMANSLEGRLPFLDHKLVEVVKKIPSDLKIHGGIEKYILREAAKPFIPNNLYCRPKFPFLAPPSTLKPNELLHKLLQDTLRSSAMSDLPFYNQVAVIKLLDQLPSMNSIQKTSIDCVLMKILSACILQKKFNVSS